MAKTEMCLRATWRSKSPFPSTFANTGASRRPARGRVHGVPPLRDRGAAPVVRGEEQGSSTSVMDLRIHFLVDSGPHPSILDVMRDR
jgi:hypothetical protein